jgi:hypothetical protein
MILVFFSIYIKVALFLNFIFSCVPCGFLYVFVGVYTEDSYRYVRIFFLSVAIRGSCLCL